MLLLIVYLFLILPFDFYLWGST